MSETEDAYNARLESMGYKFEIRDGGMFVKALYGYPFERRFETEGDLDHFVAGLDEADEWRLHFDSGGVDFDRETGLITPHDGHEPYSVAVATMWGDGGPLRREADRLTAQEIQITSAERPPHGGNWYKVRPQV